MNDLIYRDKFKQQLLGLGFYPAIVKSALEKAPAVDAVPVVRCEDCIGKSTWYNDAEYGCAICVNADCPMCCDYCPVPDIDGVCRFEKREGEING